MKNPPKHVILCYEQDQELYRIMQEEGLITKMIKPIPPFEELRQIAKDYKYEDNGSLIIIDDAMKSLEGDDMALLFSQVTHHENTSIFILTQNLFSQTSRSLRTLSLNSQYLVLFRFLRDGRMFYTLANQLRPHNPAPIIEAFASALSKSWDYIILDFTPEQSSAVRMRTRIFNYEHPPIVFFENSG